ncbi:hypothetical protein [Streptomonospora litoralis]|uniref:Uncharacterized protein n=1 Tax=Streptomonospora litoralis TaxID=2498135 RepID=A0A4P6Q1E0_9ACTN|nr:hypothetical protein [Streptomonospora litoralis]QBI54398.1 hypothetical protein EKD16_13080 [Streptomonospora litoralis]
MNPEAPPPATTPPGAALPAVTGPDADADALRLLAARLVEHDMRHGSDTIAPAAHAAWRHVRRRLRSGASTAYAAAAAELAEVAGWVLFDAEHPAAPAVTAEAAGAAERAAERPMRDFAVTNLALMEAERGRTGAAARLAADLLQSPRLPGRVAQLARIRLGRALAPAGYHQASRALLGRAAADLQDSLQPRDPAWTWWLDECEVAGHRGLALAAEGRLAAALAVLQRAADLTGPRRSADARSHLHHHVSVAAVAARLGAWPECGAALEQIRASAPHVASARNRRRLRAALHLVGSRPGAPGPLVDLARHTAGAAPGLTPIRPAGSARPWPRGRTPRG